MGQPSFTLKELAQLTQATLEGNPDHLITSVADLESATERDASFLANLRYQHFLSTSKAGVICISPQNERIAGKNYLISENPSHTFQILATTFIGHQKPTGFSGIHPTAVIHPDAKIAPEVTIAPYAVIDRDVEIGKGSYIGPFVSLSPGVKIGENCYLYPHSIVREYCTLGNRVILQPGAVIGSCGFGYTPNEKGEHVKLEQLGNVILEDDVEIGANTTVDRARFKTTRIGRGTKIDNLVQIAHNVELGSHNILAAQTGIAGSAKTGRYVIMGGQVGVVGHLEIADGVMLATRSGISKTIKEKGKYAGSPIVPLAEHNRTQVHLRKIEEYAKRIEALEKKLNELSTSKVL